MTSTRIPNMTQTKFLVHQVSYAIAWGDMDALGHVNHARYFEYFQEARIEWLATLNIDLKQTSGPVVVHAACNFLKPVIYPAFISIDTYIHTPGRSSINIEHELHQDGILMAQGACKIVWVDYIKTKPIAFPTSIRALFE